MAQGVRLSSLKLRVEIDTDGGLVIVTVRRPTVRVLDGIQKALKEVDKESMDSLLDVVKYQLVPLLDSWNLTDDNDAVIPFDPEIIVDSVPYDIITAILDTVNRAVRTKEENTDPKNSETAS